MSTRKLRKSGSLANPKNAVHTNWVGLLASSRGAFALWQGSPHRSETPRAISIAPTDAAIAYFDIHHDSLVRRHGADDPQAIRAAELLAYAMTGQIVDLEEALDSPPETPRAETRSAEQQKTVSTEALALNGMADAVPLAINAAGIPMPSNGLDIQTPPSTSVSL